MKVAVRLLGPALAVLGLALVAPSLAHDVSAEIAALEERVEELQVQEMLLQSEIRGEGGSATAHVGIAGAEARIRYDQAQVAQLEEIAALYGKSVEEMRAISQQYDSRPWFTMSGVAKEGAQEVVEEGVEYAGKRGLERLGKQSLSRIIGPAGIVGDVVEHGGKLVIRINDASRLRQEAIAQHIRLNDVLGTIVQFQREIQREHVRIRTLQGLQERFRRNNDELATTRERLRSLQGHAHQHANTTRVTDAEGDAALAAQERRSNVRLCDPSQKHRPVGIRPAQKEARPQAKPAGEKVPVAKEAPGGFVAGAACVDIVGLWRLQQTIEMHGRKMPMGGQVQAEIVGVAAGADGTPRYEVYAHSKATAKNALPLMRCSRTGHQLACQRRVQQHACPSAKYVWAPLPLTVAADVGSIEGNLRQSYVMDSADACSVVDAGAAGVIGFRFTKPPPPKKP